MVSSVKFPFSQDYLMSCLKYDAQSGLFTNKKGRLVGSVDSNKYIVICVDKKQYKAHRLAWLYHYGEDADFLIDHKNQNKKDNRIENLRKANHSINGLNISKAQKNSKTQIRGVHACNGKYRVRIRVSGKFMHIGMFKDVESARIAYENAKKKFINEVIS